MEIKNTESDISVIGLGTMGATLARALLNADYKVTVWNRSTEKILPLVERGALRALSSEAAIKESSLIIMCLSDKATCKILLKNITKNMNFKDKVIINVSTGLESEAEFISHIVEESGGLYLDGGILSYPRDIGKSTTCILYSGSEDAYTRYESILRVIAGSSMYLGSDPKKCTQLYFPFYIFYFGCLAAWMEGASLAAVNNISLSEFSTLFSVVTDMLKGGIVDAAERIDTNNFSGDQASVDVHEEGHKQIREACKLSLSPHVVTDAFIQYCNFAQQQGFGDCDVASLYTAMNSKK